jgi:NRAMP (natural resistance-associated macrophage protein)-like metal ion transporter
MGHPLTEPAEQQASQPRKKKRANFAGILVRGVITGAADDDPSAIGTYASAGARFGTEIIWLAPVILPMMYIVVYLSSKLGQVSGRGLFHVIRDYYPRWLLWAVLVGVMIGNVIEAAADLGGMAAALGLFINIPAAFLVTGVAVVVFTLQCLASYKTTSRIFRWLSLALLAYLGSAILAQPDPLSILRGTFIPKIHFTTEFLSIVVAMVGTSLSAYIYTWQSNQEVEEQIAEGKTTLEERKGATKQELRNTQRDVVVGMAFANLIMYCIMVSTGATLHEKGQTSIETAAQAAEALRPIAGDAAGVLFALGIIGVGFLAVPVMTTGAAYDLAQAVGWKATLNARPREAKKFYMAIGVCTAIAVSMNFLGFNPMQALVWSGVVQGFSTPPLLLLIMFMTNNRKIMGNRVNGRFTNFLGWLTTAAIFSASAGLVATWFL